MLDINQDIECSTHLTMVHVSPTQETLTYAYLRWWCWRVQVVCFITIFFLFFLELFNASNFHDVCLSKEIGMYRLCNV